MDKAMDRYRWPWLKGIADDMKQAVAEAAEDGDKYTAIIEVYKSGTVEVCMAKDNSVEVFIHQDNKPFKYSDLPNIRELIIDAMPDWEDCT